jgi:hypothetical protein
MACSLLSLYGSGWPILISVGFGMSLSSSSESESGSLCSSGSLGGWKNSSGSGSGVSAIWTSWSTGASERGPIDDTVVLWEKEDGLSRTGIVGLDEGSPV